MTNQKLYALKTSDGQCVVKRNGDLIVTNNPYSHDFEKEIISLELSAPCEWVEVCVIEAKPVTEEVIESILTAQETIGMETPYQFTESLQVKKAQITWRVGFCNGFRACLRYLGVG